MRKKKRSDPAKPRADQARPQISFRVQRPLLLRMDGIAAHLKITRSDLLSAVLTEYLVERGDETILDILAKETARATPTPDLFS